MFGKCVCSMCRAVGKRALTLLGKLMYGILSSIAGFALTGSLQREDIFRKTYMKTLNKKLSFSQEAAMETSKAK